MPVRVLLLIREQLIEGRPERVVQVRLDKNIRLCNRGGGIQCGNDARLVEVFSLGAELFNALCQRINRLVEMD